ncbi:unnamed protein product [Trifolium pratense]|uniref:Uncharacterized protein n=1 Tax=Trifolium pratense TaxID=57577 RepID=A0ACB0LEE7_TRIPR|nr:unnamed protein product [Trifolium pratense]
MFRVLSTCSRFAWGAIALVELYDTLNDASIFTTKGLAGYATLLQCWIHEYFPTLGRRAESGIDCDIPGASLPRARRWRYRQGNVKLPAYRPVLDALTPDDVIWRPFQDHRAAFPFDLVSMYSGYLRGCTVVRYLPERCIRQFGYVQYIPPPPLMLLIVTGSVMTSLLIGSFSPHVQRHMLLRLQLITCRGTIWYHIL